MTSHILGFPRIGAKRELKRALESYWKDEIDLNQLKACQEQICLENWRLQKDAGMDLITVNDFSFYDHMLDTAVLLNVIPERFQQEAYLDDDDLVSSATYFKMARGRDSNQQAANDVIACEMTKWFDTNYHYIVPELTPDVEFKIAANKIFSETELALKNGYNAKPVLVGPLTFLYLAKSKHEDFNPLQLLPQLLPVYVEILQRLKNLGVNWVQIDEPILCLDLDQKWQSAFETAYNLLQSSAVNILLATYFGALQDNLNCALNLPVKALHVDITRSGDELDKILDQLPVYKILSLGIVDGRNVWRNDLDKSLQVLSKCQQQLQDRLWIGSSCSLLHSPVDIDTEIAAKNETQEMVLSWLAFAVQKLKEIQLLSQATANGKQNLNADLAKLWQKNQQLISQRQNSAAINNQAVKQRLAKLTAADFERDLPYAKRSKLQADKYKLPLFPTTTIGSFPQTATIRQTRLNYKQGKINFADYQQKMQQTIASVIEAQKKYEIDVLVHGEAERNDMVEYFAEFLIGYTFTSNGWVQSYGSRCVKPPIIYGDVSRPNDITVPWSVYAQSLSDKPIKGMLTGPVTMLQWSFVRDDQPRETTCTQIALALQDEVLALEKAGIGIIQIDEPALREGLPLRKSQWQEYLNWAVNAFKLAAAKVAAPTQIHTHMCYSEFNDIMQAIAALDADVITIETSRSAMVLLDAFADFEYPNEIGPGVYDIHSPRVPKVSEMVDLMEKAAALIPAQRLWVNPDCGLKTRDWPETEAALLAMVEAAKVLRQNHAQAAAY